MPRPKKRRSIPPIEVDLIPVLSCMFLLVPALLLAMEAANWAVVPVSPPRTVSAGAANQAEPLQTLSVQVRGDGFALSMGRTEGQPAQEVLPLDYEALAERAIAVKAAHPSVDQVRLSAEGDVSLQSLVDTMDALRGRDCSLSVVGPESECLFWRVEIDA
ncbi:MAG: biopolymer transporter ExbD [Myxococcota bacterium]